MSLLEAKAQTVMAAPVGSKLESLANVTVLVADTGELDAIRRLRPVDCTTNPTLLLKAAASAEGKPLFEEAVAWGRGQTGAPDSIVAAVCDRFTVALGAALSELVPGRVSTEVDADLSFDRDATVAKARELIAAYEARGVGRERILIKIASTWEGIQAVRQLQREGIDCNLTLMFSNAQAIAAAQAGAFLISPFVGRILDWHVKAGGGPFTAETDPGVLFVRGVHDLYKAQGWPTIVMGASFRNTGEIEALAGCDRLTISAALLDALASEPGDLPLKLHPAKAKAGSIPELGEPAFRHQLNEDAMATEKLSEGIRQFVKDLRALRKMAAESLGS
jgi:transaldolase